jgi:ATP-dependent DNA helicase RecG
VGSTNRLADEQLRAEMQRFADGESFDERPVPGADSEALDFRLASESFASVRRRISRKHLETLGLMTLYQGRLVPTVGGMLLFGKDRQVRFPDAWIQAGRFAGTDRTTIFDHADLLMPPLQAIEQAVTFVEKHSVRGAIIGRVRREDRWNLPPAAVREAVVNAVVHTDYSQRGAPIWVAIIDDRLEIENPGLLPFGLTLEDLPLGISKLRNRVIGRVFHELGLIERWGSGIQRILSVCREAGLAEPTWEEIGIRLRVTLRTTRLAEAVVDETDSAILSALDRSEGLGTRDVAASIGLTPRATRTRLAGLVARGLVREIGTGPTDPRRLYHRARA